MSWGVNNRWQAFGLHLLISVLIFIALAGVIYFLWYPGFLFHYDGGLEGMKLIAGVDLVIGPSLTLLVYKIGKKTLRFDLACIAILQLVCIGGGMWAVWQTRPVTVVYAMGSYVTLNQHAYVQLGYQPGKIEILQGRWPVWLTVKFPKGEENGIGAVWAVMGENVHASVENYADYKEAIPLLAKEGLQGADIKDAKDNAQGFQQEHPDSRFFPVTTSMYSGYLAVDIKTGNALGFFEQIRQ